MSNYKIDIVIPWVDSTDPKWIQQKIKYDKNNMNEGNNEARFRDWDNLKYVFRSIEKNMPFINHIFLVTAGQVPNWLSSDNKKVSVIFHEQFIPKEYLPTFSSHVIELNIHRIPNLSDKFIYFNDDIFVINKLNEKDFFYKNKPCDSAIMNVHCEKRSQMIHSIANNDVALVNDYFELKKSISQKPFNWFNFKYGLKLNLQNIILSQCPRFPGFKQFHLANAFLKETFLEIWDKEYEYLNNLCKNKFRTINDVNQWLIRDWQLASNSFFPCNKKDMGILIDFEKKTIEKQLKLCKKIIFGTHYKMICINDGDTITNLELLKKELNKMLEEKFPKKCSFEK